MKYPKIVILLIICVVLCSCHKAEPELSENQQYYIKELNNYIFEANCYALTGKCNLKESELEHLYYPSELKYFAGRRYIENGRFFYYAEKYAPDKLGIIDSLGFYSPSEDDARWVENLIIRVEEERIAQELSDMEEMVEEAELPEENPSEEIEKMLSEEIEPVEMLDNTNTLKFMEYDNEVFMPQKVNDGWVIIHSIDSSITRNFYDESYRITKKELWNISSIDNAEIKQTEDYLYDGESAKVSQKNVSTDETYQEVKYREDSLINSIESYSIFEEEKYLSSKLTRKYDDEARLIEETCIEYTYKDVKKKKKLDYTFTKRHTYRYNEDEDIPPDFEYFEDDVLKMKNKYSNIKGTYTSQIFFEDGFSVKTYYEDELKVKDLYYQDDEVTRIKEYER